MSENTQEDEEDFPELDFHIPPKSSRAVIIRYKEQDEKREEALQHYHFILEILRLQSDYSVYGEPIYWRTDGEHVPVTFWVLCNDVFWWAAADAEQVTLEDVPELRQAIEDVRTLLEPEKSPHYCIESYETGCELWCARKRKMRPQQPAYPKDDRLRALFDACGPVRKPEEEG